MKQHHPIPTPAAFGPLRAAALLGALLCAASFAGAADVPRSDLRRICIRGACFEAELAVTSDERSRGLMFRDTLPKDRGMLFVFPEEGPHGFWMKNTRIELDIVFIGADRRVVSIARRAKPCRQEPCEVYGPEADVAYALEIAGGLAAIHGFAAGDLVEFREAAAGR